MHYIRCVKPNTQSVPSTFDDALVADQLRCAGMIEAVRISRAAYPNRLRHEYFMQRFGPLAAGATTPSELLKALIPDDSYYVGATKIFFKPRVMPMLETMRAELCARLVTRIQAQLCDMGFVMRSVCLFLILYLVTATEP